MALKFPGIFRARSAHALGDQELVGLLEPGIEFEGRMTAASGLPRINTHLKGEVDCGGVAVIAEQGEVEGEIRARSISIAGKVKGTIRASEKVEIKAKGIVLGDIQTPLLVIEPGGYFDGRCRMPVPEIAHDPVETEDEKQKAWPAVANGLQKKLRSEGIPSSVIWPQRRTRRCSASSVRREPETMRARSFPIALNFDNQWPPL